MEKVLTFLFGWVFLSWLLAEPAAVQAQVPDSIPARLPNTMLKTVPIHLEEVNVAVEKFNRPDRSFQYGAGYIYRSMSNGGSFGEPVGKEVNGLSLRLAYRMYSGKRFASPQGGYHGPLATYRYMTFAKSVYYDQFNKPQSLKLRQQVFSLQYMLGIQRVFKEWLVVDAFMGLGGRLKYATQKDTGAEPGMDMYQGSFYGLNIKAGPDWVLLFGPSISLNIAFGFVL